MDLELTFCSLCKESGDVVAIKTITVFDVDDINDVVNELKKNIGDARRRLKGGGRGLEMGHSAESGQEFEARIFDVFCYAGNLFLVLEYFEYGSILDLVSVARINLLAKKLIFLEKNVKI